MWLATPPAGRGRTARDLGIDLGERERTNAERPERARRPAQWLEHSPLLTWLVVALGGAYLVRYFCRRPSR